MRDRGEDPLIGEKKDYNRCSREEREPNEWYMMKRFLIKALLLIPVFGAADAFGGKTDSLLGLLEGALHDTARINTLNQLAAELRNSSPAEAALHAEKALKLSLEIDWKKGIGSSHNMLGTINKNQGSFDAARKHHEEALAIYTALDDKRGIANSLNGMGLAIQKLGDYRAALECYLKSLSIAKELNDARLEGKLCNNIGLVYDNLGEFEKAFDHFNKYMQLCEKENDQQGLMTSYGNIGLIYLTRHDSPYFNNGKGAVPVLAQSIEYSQKALAISHRLGQRTQQVYLYLNMGDAWLYLYDKAPNGSDIRINGKTGFISRKAFLDSAEKAFDKAVEINAHVGDRRFMSHVYSSYSEIYLYKGDYRNAIIIGKKAYEIADSLGAKHRMMNSALTLSRCYRAMNDFKQALQWYEQSNDIEDMLLDEEKQKDLGRLEAKFEYERKMIEQGLRHEKEQAIADERTARQRTITFTAIGGALALALFSLVLFNRFSVTRRHKRIIEEQKQQVDLAFNQLHEKNKEVLDSINYSQRIQNAILPTQAYLSEALGAHSFSSGPRIS
jgi:tetratricopeptide (TPR) repeat protein